MGTFFYDLNKRLNELAAPKETLNEGVSATDYKPKSQGGTHKELTAKYHKTRDPQDAAAARRAGATQKELKGVAEGSCGSMGEAGYSAKAARAGKDIGRPGKQFAKIAKSAAERYGSEERGEKVAGAVLKKLRAMDEAEMDEGNEFSGALAKARETGSATFRVDGRTYQVKEAELDEANEETKKDFKARQERLAAASAQTAKDPARLARLSKIPGYTAAMDLAKKTTQKEEAELDEREFDDKEKFDRQGKPGDTYRGHKGTVTKTRSGETHRRRHEEEPESDRDDDSDAPKTKGRPRGTRRAIGAKGPTGHSKLLKKDAIKETEVEEDYDRDEYDEEGEMAKSQSRTIADAAMELQDMLGDNENLPEWVQKKINLAMDYIDAVRDYLKANRPEDDMVAEKAVSQAQRAAAGIARAAQKGDIPQSKLRGASLAMAKMPAGELKKFAKTKEKGLPRRAKSQEVDERLDTDAAADRYLKMATADLRATQDSMGRDDEWDTMSDRQKQKTLSRERSRRSGIQRAQDKITTRSKSPTKKSVREVDTGQADARKTSPSSQEHNEKVFARHREKAKKERADHDKEKPVKETTVSGSVAPSADTPKKSKGGMQYGKGIYDSFDRAVENLIAESMNVSMNVSSEGQNSVTVTATDEDAAKLASLLKMAGIGGAMGSDDHACPSCGGSPCGCAEQVDENQPDWPTNTETSADALQYSGGLNRPKSTGQTTAPIVASQIDRVEPEDDEDDLDRLREMAGISEAAKPDFLDVDKDGDKKEPMKKAAKEKEHDDEEVRESILDMTRLWKAYQG